MKIRTIGIRGAGMSGLCLARELLVIDPHVKVTLFDTRPRLPHPARTFCFFRTALSRTPLVSSLSWDTVMFRGPSLQRRIDVSHCPYTMIRGDAFFSAILKELEQQHVECIWECESVEVLNNDIRANGITRTFDTVIDAAFSAPTAHSLMWQSFGGLWVTTENPVFDPTAAILMDLHESSTEAPVGFLYILPTSPHSALVEHTTFSQIPLSEQIHRARCIEWLERNRAGAIQTESTEYGLIPMGLQTRCQARVPTVGSAAGVVRPSTGYAFVRAQNHAKLVATSILFNTRPPPRPYPRWLTITDTLFLQALLNVPEKGAALLEGFLSRARSDALVAFLSGEIKLRDALSMWLSMPKGIMIRSLLRV